VELAEAKLRDEPVSLTAVRDAVSPMFDAAGGDQIDTVVLACTHFPLLQPELKDAFSNVAYVDGGAGIARRIAFLTRGQEWPAAPCEGLMLFTSATTRPAQSALARFSLGGVRIL
jgi:glutamate racemase